MLSTAKHSGPKADNASRISLWLSFSAFSGHTGCSESGSFGAVLNVIKVDVEHAATESGSPMIEDLANLVKTKTRSSVTANQELVLG